MRRVGFIINSRVPEVDSLRRGMPPQAFLRGWDDSASPMSFMRFRWIAEALQGTAIYELYRPWRSYDAVVFLKSMGGHCLRLAERLRHDGVCVIFEANVDYYTQFVGDAQIEAMSPSVAQRRDAVAITRFSNRVIASSRHLATVCETFNPHSEWVPDNVNHALIPHTIDPSPMRDGRLQVWWSGMAAKAFEFLAAEEALGAFSGRIHLHFVTDDLDAARKKWPAQVRGRFDAFLGRIDHTIHRFHDVPDLLVHYASGGVIVSPRFLDVPYNLSHTEWKLTLGMACGLPALASPVPSYRDVAARADAGAITICSTTAEWTAALDAILSDPGSLVPRGAAARKVVDAHYATPVVARQHHAVIEAALQGALK